MDRKGEVKENQGIGIRMRMRVRVRKIYIYISLYYCTFILPNFFLSFFMLYFNFQVPIPIISYLSNQIISEPQLLDHNHNHNAFNLLGALSPALSLDRPAYQPSSDLNTAARKTAWLQ